MVQDSVTQTNTPHAEFHVKSGYRYRFRIIGGVTASCVFQVAIQDHNLTVIAVDGYPVQPVVVNTVIIAAGLEDILNLIIIRLWYSNNAYPIIVNRDTDRCCDPY